MNIKIHITYNILSLLLQAAAAVCCIATMFFDIFEYDFGVFLFYCFLGLLQVVHTMITVIFSKIYKIKKWHLYYLLISVILILLFFIGLYWLILTSPIVAVIYFISQWMDLKPLMNTNTHDLKNNTHNDE